MAKVQSYNNFEFLYFFRTEFKKKPCFLPARSCKACAGTDIRVTEVRYFRTFADGKNEATQL